MYYQLLSISLIIVLTPRVDFLPDLVHRCQLFERVRGGGRERERRQREIRRGKGQGEGERKKGNYRKGGGETRRGVRERDY
jgi:hypothetical protein